MWITNIDIVLPDHIITRGAIQLDGPRIVAIQDADAPATSHERVIDGHGLTAIPGIIDLHGDMIEREVEPRPGARFPLAMAIHELDKRLAACGVTTAYAAISFYGANDDEALRSGAHAQALVAAIVQLRATLLVAHLIHARYEVPTPVVAAALLPLIETRQVDLFSLTDHTPGQGQFRDVERFIAATAKWRNADPQQVAGEIHAQIATMHANTDVWDTAAALVALARSQRVLVASHDDDTPAKIDRMLAFGATISEFPVTLEAAHAARQRGMCVVMGAPNVLRGGSHSGNVSALDAIAAGAVDALAADYAPAALLQAAFIIARNEVLPLYAAVNLISRNPAVALGLHDRGALAIGMLADLVLVEPGACPRVRATLRRGVPIYWDGSMAQR